MLLSRQLNSAKSSDMKTTCLFPLLFVTCVSLSACSMFDDEADVEAPETVSTESSSAAAAALYNDAREKMGSRIYQGAITDFEEVERRYPYSDLAVRAQVMAGYTAYDAEEYDQAISILERYVRMQPGDSSVPYAYYLIALCSYEQISDVGRDQKMTERAMQALTEVMRRFPKTDYARDAKLKLDLTVDHLAGKEMEIGRYYQSRNEFLAAINRFRFVVENYQTTSHIPEALHRLTETYTAIGLDNEAQRYAAVLGHNYPSSVWYRDSYQLATGEEVTSGKKEKDEGWLDGWFN